MTDARPINCRFRLRDEGKSYPRSSCQACGKSIATGLGKVCRATPQAPHIITHEGRTYDLTALETPFGLLPEVVRDALKAWPHGLEMMTYSGKMIEYNFPDMTGKRGAVWRARPAPVETRVDCYRGEYFTAKDHGTCIKRADGSIDWATWEPQA